MDIYSAFHDVLSKGHVTICDGSADQLELLCERLGAFCDETDTAECEVSYDSDCDVAQIGLVFDQEVPISKNSVFWDALSKAHGLHVESRDDYGEDGVQISFVMVCQQER